VIEYERDNWWRTCFAFAGTVLPHVLDRVGLLTGFCLLLCLVERFILEQFDHPLPALDQLGHAVLGVAMSMLIVFRTNSSNNRFWEARSLWGSMVNSSRNLARMGAVYAAPADDLAKLITAYVLAVKETLRGNRDLTALRPFLSRRLFERATTANSPPTMLSQALSQWVQGRYAAGRLDVMAAMKMERLIALMVDAQGGCEKIRKTPLPFVYAALIKQLLLLYLISLPFVLVTRMGFAAPLVVAVVSFGMLGIEEAGVEIEDPFGLNANHLPLDKICETIAKDAAALTDPSA
jgi:putative membrane protein